MGSVYFLEFEFIDDEDKIFKSRRLAISDSLENAIEEEKAKIFEKRPGIKEVIFIEYLNIEIEEIIRRIKEKDKIIDCNKRIKKI